MKLIILLLVTSLSFAQFRLNTTQYSQVSVVVDPVASIKENGLHIGLEIENVRTLYERFAVTNFAALKNGYTDLVGSFGLSFTTGMWEKTRFNAGIRLGTIIRNGVHPLIGFECGIDENLCDWVSIGLRAYRDCRTDMKDNDGVNQWRNNGVVRLSFKF
jgi:hypothetical protein